VVISYSAGSVSGFASLFNFVGCWARDRSLVGAHTGACVFACYAVHGFLVVHCMSFIQWPAQGLLCSAE